MRLLLFCITLGTIFGATLARYEDCESPPSVENASISLEDEEDTVRAIYSCQNGFVLKGSNELICDLDTDEWNLDPPTCVKAEGSNDVDDENADSRPKKKKTPNVMEATEVSLQLAPSLDMSCVQAKVKAPEIRHGFVQKYDRRRKGDHLFLVAFYACNDRFEFEDTSKIVLYCSDQKWVGELPVCIALGEYVDEEEEGDGEDYDEYERVDEENEGENTDAEEDENDILDENISPSPSPSSTTTTIPIINNENIDDQLNNEIPSESEINNVEPEVAATATTVPSIVVEPTQDPYTPRVVDSDCGPDNGGCEHKCERLLFPGENEPRLKCSCYEGFSLDPYDYSSCHDVDECENNNGGCEQICNNLPGSFECSCEKGLQIDTLTGSTCIDIDECLQESILTECNGNCENTVGSYNCVTELNIRNEVDSSEANVEAVDCPAGYELADDENTCLDINECEIVVEDEEGDGVPYKICSNGCVNTMGSFICTCDSNQHLLPDQRTCAPDSCQDLNNVQLNKTRCAYDCIDLPSGVYECVCPSGYSLGNDLHSCDMIEDICTKNGGYERCMPGSCVANADNNGFSCNCPAGYKTEHESCVDVNECNEGHQCSHECLNTEGSYRCNCPGGFRLVEGSEWECEDIDECQSKENLCGSLTCFNQPGTFRCLCPDASEPNPDTGSCNIDDPCSEHQCSHQCIVNNSERLCVCPQEMILANDGLNCIYADLCQVNNNGCEQICSSGMCSCSSGFVLAQDGKSCTDIDECQNNNGGCHQECQNHAGSFSCACDEGYQLNSDKITCSLSAADCPEGYVLSENGDDCIRQDRCSINNGGCSHACTPNGCACPAGSSLQQNGLTCEDIDECAMPGTCEYQCINTKGSYKCTCPKGYELQNGRNCVDINECLDSDNACIGGECINHSGGFECRCPPGFKLALDRKTCVLQNVVRDQCQAFIAPMNGQIHCTKYRHKKKHFYNTKCKVWCNQGYRLEGPSHRLCNSSGNWDQFENKCLPIVCPQLPTPRNGILVPNTCVLGKSYMGERCRLQCHSGFVPSSDSVVMCTAQQQWSSNNTLECIQAAPTNSFNSIPMFPTFNAAPKVFNAERTNRLYPALGGKFRPFINCPRNTTVLLGAGQNTAHIILQKPVTNLEFMNVESYPAWGKSLQARLAEGFHSVSFVVRDPRTGKQARCNTHINVRRPQAPKISFCTPSFEVTLNPNQGYRSIMWNEPRFEANSGGGLKKIYKSRIPGELFVAGMHPIFYEATNEDGMSARCEFKILVKPSTNSIGTTAQFNLNGPRPASIISPLMHPPAIQTTARLLEGHESFVICPGKPAVKVTHTQSVHLPVGCTLKNVRSNPHRRQYVMKRLVSPRWSPFIS